MKKSIAITMMVMLLVGFVAYAKTTASMKMSETVWDFGTIKQKSPVSHEFTFTNTGDGNLVILDATAECGCTTPEYPKNPIAPGKSGKIKVTYNPVGRPGSFEKTVTIKTNGSPKKVRVKIRGTVMP